MQRVTDLADPNRCKGSLPDGQCQNVAEEGADYCRVHGGVDHAPARRLKQYLLTRTQDDARLARLLDNDGLKTLREEVVLALEQLKRRLNLAESDAEFLAAYPEVEKSLKTLADLKKANFFLEQKSGAMLSRDQAFGLFQEIISIVVDELADVPDYTEIMDRIITRVGPAIKQAARPESDKA